jgi:hypothetical protein
MGVAGAERQDKDGLLGQWDVGEEKRYMDKPEATI